MILEKAVALALGSALVHHPDPLDGLSALEHILDRHASEAGKSLPSALRPTAETAAKDTIQIFMQEAQAVLDEIELDRAKDRSENSGE